MHGYFCVFNSPTRIREWDHQTGTIKTFMEQISPGACARSIREDRIRCLFSHGKDPSIGDKPIGEIVELREDDHGCRFEVKLFDCQYVRELLPALKANQFGSSFRFEVEHEEVTPGTAGKPEERVIGSMRIREISCLQRYERWCQVAE